MEWDDPIDGVLDFGTTDPRHMVVEFLVQLSDLLALDLRDASSTTSSTGSWGAASFRFRR